MHLATRPFDADDAGACLALFDSNVPEFFTAAERPAFEAFLSDRPGPYQVLEVDSAIVGCGGYALREEGTVADLCWGMIRRDLHGSGLGRVLTEARLRRARRDPRVGAIHLSTSQKTIGFYERLGFRVVAVEKDGFGPGLDRCDMRMAGRAEPADPSGVGSRGGRGPGGR